MPLADFEEWVTPSLELRAGGRTYTVRPPSVEAGQQLIASAIRGEINLGMIPGVTKVPDEVQRVLDTITPGQHPALGDVYEQMRADGLDKVTIDRAAYYAVFYWTRGKAHADDLARQLWTPRATDVEFDDVDDAHPKD
ncbi:MAG: hypothetical protein FJW64_05015 [Actinobacteria bacterium]|nr:hypothetical protein [Actinomycetota bacterium]